MALGTPTLLRTAFASTASLTTASFTPTAGALLVVHFTAKVAGGPGGTATITDSAGLTWTEGYALLRDLGGTSPRQRLVCWHTIVPASPVAMTVTCGSTGLNKNIIAVSEITGAMATTNVAPLAFNALGTPTATLATAPAATSVVLQAVAMIGANPVSPPAASTEITEVLATDYILEVAYAPAPSATTWTYPVNSNTGASGGGIEIAPSTSSSASGFTETAATTDTVGSLGVAISAGFTETAATTDSAGSLLLPSNTTRENPTSVWIGAAAAWKMPGGADSKAVNDLTVSGVTATTLLGGPAGTFAAGSYAKRSVPTFAAMRELTVEVTVQPTAFGRIYRLGSRTDIAGGKIEISTSSTGAYTLKRTVGAATQTSVTAAGMGVLNQVQHIAAVFPQAGNHRLYINGAEVTLTNTGAAVNAALTIASTDEVAIGATDAAAVNDSLLAWPSGVVPGAASSNSAWRTMRARTVDCNITFPGQSKTNINGAGWNGEYVNWINNPFIGTQLTNALNAVKTVIVTMPLMNYTHQSNFSYVATCPDGDTLIQTHLALAQKIKTAIGVRTIYMRLGHEANAGDTFDISTTSTPNIKERYPWHFKNPITGVMANAADYKAAWRRIARIYQNALGSQVKMVWNLVWQHDTYTQVGNYYPGDAAATPDYVDVVSLDVYDNGNPYFVNSDANWTKTLGNYDAVTNGGQARGLQGILDFAKAKGKKFAIDEWGPLQQKVGDPPAYSALDGSNNDFFPGKMFAFCTANAADIAFESYFQGLDSHQIDPATTYLPLTRTAYIAAWTPT
jgi:hypothetical protein